MSDDAVQDNTNYSHLIEEIFRRIRTTGSTAENRVVFERWMEIFQAPSLPLNSKSFKALKMMDKESAEKQEESATCTICIDNLCNSVDIPEDYVIKDELKTDATTFRSSVVIMPCKHRYHYFCLTLWLEKKRTCPTCREQVKTDIEYDTEERQKNLEELHDTMFS